MQTAHLPDGTALQVVDPAQGLRTWAHFGPVPPPLPDVVTYLTPPDEDRRAPGRDGEVARIAFYALCCQETLRQGLTQRTQHGVPFALMLPMCLGCGVMTGNWCFGCETQHQVFSTPRCGTCEAGGIICPVCGTAMEEVFDGGIPQWAQQAAAPQAPDGPDPVDPDADPAEALAGEVGLVQLL